ncbi:MAG: glycosyltransferase, partial [Arenicella sp.]|nr:glycosyltransferase [Arenicella sp.]
IRYSTKTAIEHYVGVGEREGRQPNAVFAPYFYMQNRPDEIAKWESALVHYIKEGADNGDNPSPTFSTKFYAQAHQLPFAESLAHYLQEITKSGRTSLTEPGVAQESAKTALEISTTNYEPAVVGPIETEIFGLMNELERVTLDEKISALNFVVVEEPLVSIIIPFFNKLEYTVDCLFALSRQAFKNYEVILVDDASTSDDCSTLNSIGGIEIIRNETNQGYLLSCNLAASASSGGYIVQLNNDTLVLEGWLSNLVNTFEIDSAVGLVGSLLLSRNGQISEAGGIIFNDASGYNYGRGKSPYEKRFNYCREVDYCSGASIIIKRHIWESLGGYDKTFVPAYYEDTDLAMQVRELGYKVVYNPLSKVVHHEGISSGTDLKSGIKKYQEINKGKFYKKWTKVLDAKPPIPSGDLIDDYVRRQRKSGWILWIDSVTPTPDKDSGSIDTVNFFEQAMTDDWGVTFMPWDGLRHEGRYTTSLLSMGVECIFDPSSSAEQHLNALDDSYDVIVLSRVTVAKYAYPIVKKLYPNAKIIFNTVDLHFLRYERESALLAKTSKLQLSVRSQKVDKEEELELVRNCDTTTVVSESEQTVLNNYIESAKVKVIPLFRDVVGCSNSYEQRFDIGFIGGYQHPPNIDAVKYFISDVWPLVSKKIKHCKFIIAGSNAPEEILRLAGPRIEVRGFIPTVSELLEDVKLMVAPLRYGAGIKGKIVSALCHGVPQVVTAEAADGICLENTGAVIIADDAQQFANAIIELYTNNKKWNEMSLLALDAARQKYSKDAISGKITDLLNEL